MEEQLVKKKQQDLFISQQVGNQSFKVKKSITDISDICKETLEDLQPLAKYLQIQLDLHQPLSYNQEVKEAIFTAIVDKKLLKIILQKLLEIGLFLSRKDGSVSITPIRADHIIEVVINFDYYIPNPTQQNELFMQDYGSLTSVNNLKISSGLEGLIADGIAAQLNIPLKVIPKPDTKQTSLVLYITI